MPDGYWVWEIRRRKWIYRISWQLEIRFCTRRPGRLTRQKSGQRIQKIIDDMVRVMRLAPGVGLAAPQIGVPLRVMVNPELKGIGNKKALFFEGCLSVDGFRAMVERYLEVAVTGYDRQGKRIEVNASGWQARILQHECDHLDGNLYVDKMIPRTFRTVDNLDLPLAEGCPKLGPQ